MRTAPNLFTGLRDHVFACFRAGAKQTYFLLHLTLSCHSQTLEKHKTTLNRNFNISSWFNNPMMVVVIVKMGLRSGLLCEHTSRWACKTISMTLNCDFMIEKVRIIVLAEVCEDHKEE